MLWKQYKALSSTNTKPKDVYLKISDTEIFTSGFYVSLFKSKTEISEDIQCCDKMGALLKRISVQYLHLLQTKHFEEPPFQFSIQSLIFFKFKNFIRKLWINITEYYSCNFNTHNFCSPDIYCNFSCFQN